MKPEKFWVLIEVDLSFTKDEVELLAECSRCHYDAVCQAAERRGFINGLRNVMQDGVAVWRFDPQLVGLACKILEQGALMEKPTAHQAMTLSRELYATLRELNERFYASNPKS